MDLLNLFSGLGGNRALWKGYNITAIDNDPMVAAIYSRRFPEDKMIIGDAYEYLEKHYQEFDIIWASPPCPTHSRLNFSFCEKNNHSLKIPDMRLYGIIIFLKQWFTGYWFVENTISYYEPLIKPIIVGRHYVWSNVGIKPLKKAEKQHRDYNSVEAICKIKGFDYEFIKDCKLNDKRKHIRNCVKPKIGRYILNSIKKQEVLEKWIS